jgi:hypothetical protein
MKFFVLFRPVSIRLFEPYCPHRLELQYDRKFMPILKKALRRALERRHELRPMRPIDFYRLERGKSKDFRFVVSFYLAKQIESIPPELKGHFWLILHEELSNAIREEFAMIN